jgi:hypothetical protein
MGHDLRKYARQTNFRIIIGFIFLLCVIGLGSIYAFYGPGAAIMGLICLAGAGLPVILIGCALWLINWIAKRGSLNP